MFDFANTDKYLARYDELSKSCISRRDDASVPKPRSLSIEWVPILISIGAYYSSSDHLQDSYKDPNPKLLNC